MGYRGFGNLINKIVGAGKKDGNVNFHEENGLVGQDMEAFNPVPREPPVGRGFNDWIPIFSGGIQTDSQDNSHDGDLVIDKAIANFNPVIHEPPVVIGHPRENAPAFGWVESLKGEYVDGVNHLFAKFKQVDPEFERLVEGGSYKKRSASFYPDGTLRHVGFLGAMPPAVKGLADVSFSDSEFIEFEQPTDGRNDPSMSGLQTYSESELTTILNKAREDERRKSQLDFSERERKLQQDQRNYDIDQFVKSRVKDGIIPPAMVGSGLVEFMQSIQEAAVFEFAEGTDKSDPLSWFRNFIDDWGKSPLFTEIATRRKGCLSGADQEIEIGKSIAAKANSGIR